MGDFNFVFFLNDRHMFDQNMQDHKMQAENLLKELVKKLEDKSQQVWCFLFLFQSSLFNNTSQSSTVHLHSTVHLIRSRTKYRYNAQSAEK